MKRLLSQYGVTLALFLGILFAFAISNGIIKANFEILQANVDILSNSTQKSLNTLSNGQLDLWKSHADIIKDQIRLEKFYKNLPWDLWEKLGQSPDGLVGVEELISTVVRVEIYSKYGTKLGTASAVCIRSTKSVAYFLTAAHVVLTSPTKIRDNLNITTSDEQVLHDVVILDYDIARDLALISVSVEKAFPVAELASKEPRLNSRVIAIGCALGILPMPTEGLLTSKTFKKARWIYSAPTIFGSSGGAIFCGGKLIGISSAIYTTGGIFGSPICHMGIMCPMTEINQYLYEIAFN